MNEEQVRKILGGWIQSDGTLYCLGNYLCWPSAGGSNKICLDAHYTAEELEAITWWMRNKQADLKKED